MDTLSKTEEQTAENEEKTAENGEQAAENEWLTDGAEETRVLFVCTGNTCRSPMAAALVNELGRELNLTAESAGIYPNVGEPISENAVQALHDAGIEPAPDNRYDLHTAVQVDEEILKRCTRVVAMSERHLMALIGAFPQYIGKMAVMPHPISDPYGGDLEVYRACLEEIKAGVVELFHLDD